MPEWSIGTVSKTVVPLRVPRVRIPLSPLNVPDKTGQRTDKSHKFNDLWDFFYSRMSALKYTFSPLKDKVRNLTRTPRQLKTERGYRLSKIGEVLSLFGLSA